MKRLKLEMGDLRVESFASTNAPAVGRGTVRAHAKATQETCGCTQGYDTCDTEYDSCADGCWLGTFSCNYQSCSPGNCTAEC